MVEKEYRSSALIPVKPLRLFKLRARQLDMPALQLAKAVLTLAFEAGCLPDVPGVGDEGEEKAVFPFALPGELVVQLGGKDRARDLLRWAIVEGLDKSPLAPPGD